LHDETRISILTHTLQQNFPEQRSLYHPQVLSSKYFKKFLKEKLKPWLKTLIECFWISKNKFKKNKKIYIILKYFQIKNFKKKLLLLFQTQPIAFTPTMAQEVTFKLRNSDRENA
jgi:hypothetical protein